MRDSLIDIGCVFLVILAVFSIGGKIVDMIDQDIADARYLKPCILAGYDDAGWDNERGYYCTRTQWISVDELEIEE